MRVELVYFAGCPNVEAARQLLRRCLARSGAAAEMIEVDTDEQATPEHYRRYSSPTVLVDGRDIQDSPEGALACRLGLPTETEVLAALEDANHEKR